MRFCEAPLSVIFGRVTILPMTATGVLHIMTATIDALVHGRFSNVPALPAAAKPATPTPSPAIEMSCLRCGIAVKATFPADDAREDFAFECHGCGTVARW